jgi:hypothetical protein
VTRGLVKACVLLAALLSAGATGCAGARTTLAADDARYPISMSRGVRDANGDLVPAERRQVVGELDDTFMAWGTFYSAVRLTPHTDISDAVNEQVAHAHGDAVVALHVGSRQCTLNYLAPLSWLPIWPGCTEVFVHGDIIRVLPPSAQVATRGAK